MSEPIAYLDWSVDVECPKCKECFDISYDDDDRVVASAIFNNNWDALKDHEVICEHCKHEFKIEGVEY